MVSILTVMPGCCLLNWLTSAYIVWPKKLRQMPSGLIRHMLTYKVQRLLMHVVLQNERYTSRTCPSCQRRHKPRGRRFRCP
jgi:transposase